jgi:hypothetical protein
VNKKIIMTEAPRMKTLKLALILIGIVFVVGVYPLTIIWPSGWSWHEGQSEYLQMILGIYAVLGVFLIRAAKNPMEHLSLIWFTIWSSIVHGGIMGIQTVAYPQHVGHLLGDVPVLFIVAAMLWYLMPRKTADK